MREGEGKQPEMNHQRKSALAEFWREEGRDAFKSWMRRENGDGADAD